ncbi:MAG: AcrR family transcriptional regulator [Patiriisocius sp.]|jgi:AcrR family transcriptional regulator
MDEAMVVGKAAKKDNTWQKTKSEKTRSIILDAALRCFYERGYNNTTTEKVAHEAGVSRGAMLHHFPSRFDLIKATVHYLHGQRLELFEEQELEIHQNAEHSLINEGIDAYWKQLHSPLFTVWNELRVAARTDKELHNILKPASRSFEKSLQKVSASVFPDLALSEEFEKANMLTTYLLEGMAVNGVSNGAQADAMVSWLKTQLRAMFSDVTNINRTTASMDKTKVTVKNVTAKRVTVKKAVTKSTIVKKIPAIKTAAKKTTAKSTAPKKAPAKKATAKKKPIQRSKKL